MSDFVPHIAQQALHFSDAEPTGQLTRVDGESFYYIENYDRMPPFLMSIVSSSDLWMYLSSKGGLTAGRQHYNNALFPYETDDKIHEAAPTTGPKTLVKVKDKDRVMLWEPFSDNYSGLYTIQRVLMKNKAGNKVIFREINHDLQLRFSYSWTSSDTLGWIRKSTLENLSGESRELTLTDGLQNLIPWGIARETQSMMSTLMDAYKVAEWLPESHMALYRMSSIPVDRAEPSEALRTNTLWFNGIEEAKYFLSAKQWDAIRKGEEPRAEHLVLGAKTSFFAHTHLQLKAKESRCWHMCIDVAKDSAELNAFQQTINSQTDKSKFIEDTVAEGAQKLDTLVNLADGIQKTADPLNDNRHFANVMFNIMRGGIFEKGYDIEIKDFIRHLEEVNKEVGENIEEIFEGTAPVMQLKEFIELAQNSGDDDLYRLALEYLPLSFSRRHGDPSRPWNFFDIRVKNPDGTPSLNYQGNWRDIFQNWEALAFSFPHFLPGMICRFLNASTADGYNPYRITREGFDWEVPEPDNPWAYIGYWGDHQLIYLLRLMEMHEKFFPGQLMERFSKPIFVYAKVPYRIKGYEEILANPQDTIIFERELHEQLMEQNHRMGADGKLMRRSSIIVKATFVEKIMVSLLTKLSNFVPGAGIWLNTQRPEWNDANNALVGNGASMVTLYQLRRFVQFLLKIMNASAPFKLTEEVGAFYSSVEEIFAIHKDLLEKGFSDTDRKSFVDKLGKAGENYRAHVYDGFSDNQKAIAGEDMVKFLELVLDYVDQTITTARRDDLLYHSYNLLEFSPDAIKILPLQLMLEGQANMLSSHMLNAEQTVEMMKALFASDLWREDQKSFMLYPFKKLPSFLEKNIIPKEKVQQSALLQKLLESGNQAIVRQDLAGHFHFNADHKNGEQLKKALQKLSSSGLSEELLQKEIPLVLDIYEDVFNHRAFTGRSGSFYKYEGLGSIYWHMVSKLLLSLGESIVEFARDEKNQPWIPQLKEYYYRVKEGIGLHKKPQEYGAFPTDPYSHTPSMMGAQQPGMTGQVKEDILSRFNELGLFVQKGRIEIAQSLFEEALEEELEFSYCNIPVVYRKSAAEAIEVFTDEGLPSTKVSGLRIPENISGEIFRRTGKVSKVVVHLTTT